MDKYDNISVKFLAGMVFTFYITLFKKKYYTSSTSSIRLVNAIGWDSNKSWIAFCCVEKTKGSYKSICSKLFVDDASFLPVIPPSSHCVKDESTLLSSDGMVPVSMLNPIALKFIQKLALVRKGHQVCRKMNECNNGT